MLKIVHADICLTDLYMKEVLCIELIFLALWRNIHQYFVPPMLIIESHRCSLKIAAPCTTSSIIGLGWTPANTVMLLTPAS